MNKKDHEHYLTDDSFESKKPQTIYDLLSKSMRSETVNQFNKAICLMMGNENDNSNYLSNLENLENYRKTSEFQLMTSTTEKYEQAVAIFSKLLKTKPNHVLFYEFRGIAKSILEDYIFAIKDLDKTVELSTYNPKSAFVFYNRAIVRDKLENYKGAMDDYDKAIELEPDFDKAFHNRGDLKVEMFNDIEGAYIDYENAIESNPHYAPAYNRRSILKYKFGNFEKAIEDCNKAIEIDPVFDDAYYNRANAKFKLYDFAGAVEDYQKTLSFSLLNVKASYKLKIAMAKLNGNTGNEDEFDFFD